MRLGMGRPWRLLLRGSSESTCRSTSDRFVLVLGNSGAIIGKYVGCVSSVEI
jgi:hypothetical protein